LVDGTQLKPENSNVSANWNVPNGTEIAQGTRTDRIVPQSIDAKNIQGSVNPAYGHFYNFVAATANWVGQDTNADSPQDICPKGWNMPTGKVGGDFSALNTAMAGAGATTQGYSQTSYENWQPNAAFPGVFSGNYGWTNFENQGTQGRYSSTTSLGATYSYTPYFDSGSIIFDEYKYKYLGFPIRCVLTTPTPTLTESTSSNPNPSPNNIYQQTPTDITITGTNFLSTATVKIGDTLDCAVKTVTSTKIVCRAPVSTEAKTFALVVTQNRKDSNSVWFTYRNYQ
jgi:uncharacterized protein (TIGR02145 family)